MATAAPTIVTKRCAHCHRDLPIADFYQRGDGVTSSWCRSCQQARSRESYRERGADWNAQRREERRALREATKNQRLVPFHLIARAIGVSTQQALNIFNSGMEKLRQGASPEARGLYSESVRLRSARQTWDEAWGNTFDSEEES